MKKFQNDPLYYYGNINIIKQSEHCAFYEIKNNEGIGSIKSYQVFPGIKLMYNDFHMKQCAYHTPLRKDILEINHCRDGRFECKFINGMYTYLGEGDLSVNTMVNNRIIDPTFPLEYYHGISIFIDLENATKMISTILKDISIDLYVLRDKLCADDRCFIIRATDSIRHIFSELYTIPSEVKHGYLKLKILELLLFLSMIDISEQLEKRTYFQQSQVNKIKQIKQFLTQHIEYHFTLKELSKRFDISLSAMNSCFKAVYGVSIYAYIRTYRMHVAASMLLHSQDSITVIAFNVGYENPSKFASAFKEVMHISPSIYRKSH